MNTLPDTHSTCDFSKHLRFRVRCYSLFDVQGVIRLQLTSEPYLTYSTVLRHRFADYKASIIHYYLQPHFYLSCRGRLHRCAVDLMMEPGRISISLSTAVKRHYRLRTCRTPPKHNPYGIHMSLCTWYDVNH